MRFVTLIWEFDVENIDFEDLKREIEIELDMKMIWIENLKHEIEELDEIIIKEIMREIMK